MFEDILVDVAKGAFYGAEASLIGYLKSEDLPEGWKALLTKDFWSRFDVAKALKTVLIGAIMGAFTKGTLFLPESITSSPDFVAVTLFVPSLIVLAAETVVKVIFRRTPLMRVWDGIKTKVLALLEATQK
jgi:hypothetical protein